jgi:hypothetical protein
MFVSERRRLVDVAAKSRPLAVYASREFVDAVEGPSKFALVITPAQLGPTRPLQKREIDASYLRTLNPCASTPSGTLNLLR